jgi:imidazolonepropionase-like amidohydrolase
MSGLEEGAEADLLVFADDPRRTLAALWSTRRTVLRGRVVS